MLFKMKTATNTVLKKDKTKSDVSKGKTIGLFQYDLIAEFMSKRLIVSQINSRFGMYEIII